MSDVALQQPARDIGSLMPIAGARPLRKPAHERYARARSLLLPKVEAYRQAGLGCTDYAADRGNAAKLERKRAVLDRITFLTRQPEEVLKQKRERIEAFLWAAHETNYAEFFVTIDEPIMAPELGDDGKPTGEWIDTGRTRRVDRLRHFADLTEDQQRMIESLKWTEKGSPILTVYSRMQANIELRKLLGLGQATRDDEGSEFSRLDDASLFAELAREAKELGIDVELTFRASGAGA
jgi:hypothetical protein